ncbi:MAG TPA: hypothetical protein VE035_09475, partial [Puia sp.]|nr:hypothetical protein [Puia sp.]
IVAAGKIYVKDQYIFLNDIDKGIHVYDNSDPSHPVQTAFLNIPGNEDIAVKGNMLYADMYGDLLAIDISDLHHAVFRNILHRAFPARAYLNGNITILNDNLVDSTMVITGWINKDTTVSSQDPQDPYPYYYGGGYLLAPTYYSNAAVSSSSNGATGVAGSMAKMVLVNDYMYAITESHSLGVIGIKDAAAAPTMSAPISVGFDLQTIYPFQGYLFLGSQIGMYIYDLSNPATPVKAGTFMHGRACDPVISDGNYAYITLHSGTSCGGANNELDIVPVKDLQQTTVPTTYGMTGPHGLCKDGNLLFVCDDGLKVYDAANAPTLKLLTTITVKGSYDVMAGNHNLMVVTDQGLYQYRYDDNNQFDQLSFLAVKK